MTEAVEVSGIRELDLRAAIDEGRLGAIDVGGGPAMRHWRIPVVELRAFVEKGSPKPEPGTCVASDGQNVALRKRLRDCA